jgi:hypothetical protein
VNSLQHRLLLVGTVLSSLAALLTLLWTLVPVTNLFADPDNQPPLMQLTGQVPFSVVTVAVAALGVVGGILALRGRSSTPALGVISQLQALLFGPFHGTMVVVVPTLAVLLVRRGGVARWGVGVPILAVLLAVAVLLRRTLLALAIHLFPALLGSAGEIFTALFFVALGVCWAGVFAATVSAGGALADMQDRVVRHRELVTVLAAVGPLPYALARLTWLTPWPLFGGELAGGDGSTRLWGLTLSLGAWLGVVLTIGLIRPWGEVFPRWFPVIGGHRVPVAAAAVPGFTVAALLCFAAVPMILSGGILGPSGMLVYALFFPCWFWGPMLALAVWGYVGHRGRQSAVLAHA